MAGVRGVPGFLGLTVLVAVLCACGIGSAADDQADGSNGGVSQTSTSASDERGEGSDDLDSSDEPASSGSIVVVQTTSDDGQESSQESTSTSATSTSQDTQTTTTKLEPLQITDLSVTPKLLDAATGRSQLTFRMTTNRCVFVRVAGDTTLTESDDWAEHCVLGHVALLQDRFGPGDYSIAVDVWDENGMSTSQPLTFVVPPASTDPCRYAEPPPEVWRVKVNTPAELKLRVVGDCGPVTWRFDQAEVPDGFRFADGVLYANPTGPARTEAFQFSAVPTRGVDMWTRIIITIATAEEPDVEPCKPWPDQSLVSGGILRLRVRIGETVTSRVEAVGDCGNFAWGHGPLPPGTTFVDGVITVTGETVGPGKLLSIHLNPEDGQSWSTLFQVIGVE